MIHEALSGRIISAFYTVYNGLGHGFLEKVYENALMVEFRKQGVNVDQQKKIDVWYDGFRVGEYFSDIVVEDTIILELKAAAGIVPEHEAQLLHYLRATEIELGFVLNFGSKPEFIRRVFSNERKTSCG